MFPLRNPLLRLLKSPWLQHLRRRQHRLHLRPAAWSCLRPARAPSTPHPHRFPEQHRAVVLSLNVPVLDRVRLPGSSRLVSDPDSPPAHLVWLPVHVDQCTRRALFRAALVVLADLRALASLRARVLASLPVPDFRRVLAEPRARLRAAPRRPVFVPHGPASAVAVSATRR